MYEVLNYDPASVKEIFVLRNVSTRGIEKIVETARKNQVKLSFVGKNNLDGLSNNSHHQGIAADVKDFEYISFPDLLRNSNNSFYLLLDRIEDPNNLGAIIRTADFFNVDAVLLPKSRAAGITPAVMKTSCGTAATIPICRVANLRNAIDELKKNDFWVVGADKSAKKAVYNQNISSLKIALVIGNEGKGISKNIKSKCDFLVSIPGNGRVDSLNASVASGILIYELTKDQ